MRERIIDMGSNMKKAFKTLKGYFIQEYQYVQMNTKLVFWFMFITCLCYGSKVVYSSNQFDTIQMFAEYEWTIDWWLAIGRFSLVFMKRIFENGLLSVYFSDFLTMIFFVLAAISWSFFLSIYAPISLQKREWVLGGLFISTPVMAEQISFSLQNWEVMTGFVLIPLAIYLFFDGYKERNYYSMFLSAIILSWTVGLYQNFLSIYVLGFLMVLLFKIDTISENRKVLFLCLNFFCVFILGTGLYFCMSTILQKYYGITASSYLFENIKWMKRPVMDSLYCVIEYIKGLIFSSQNYYSSIVYGITFLLFFLEGFFVKSIHRLWNIGIRLLIILSPFYFSILFGDGLLFRMQTILPLTFGIAGWNLYSIICSKRQNIKGVCICFLIIIILRHSQIIIHAFYSDCCAYNQDVVLARQIKADINADFPENVSDKIIFLNAKTKTTSIPDNVYYENIGSSLFSILWMNDHGRYWRLTDFYNYLGYPTTYISQKEFEMYAEADYSNVLSKRYQEYTIYSYENVSVVQFY